MFTEHSQEGKIVVLIVYADDILLTRNDVVEMDQLKNNLSTKLEIKDLGCLQYFLGIEIACSRKGIVV